MNANIIDEDINYDSLFTRANDNNIKNYVISKTII